MDQISCLCSVRSWKYIHILHNNLHVTSYWYKLYIYEFKKIVNAKMLAMLAPICSECTYRVCVCHVASGDTIQRHVRWLAGFWCLSLLRILLNSKYCSTIQVGLLKMVLPTGQWRFCKRTAVYTYMYILFPAKCVERFVTVYDTNYDTKPEKNVTDDIMAHQMAMNTLLDIDWY